MVGAGAAALSYVHEACRRFFHLASGCSSGEAFRHVENDPTEGGTWRVVLSSDRAQTETADPVRALVHGVWACSRGLGRP